MTRGTGQQNGCVGWPAFSGNREWHRKEGFPQRVNVFKCDIPEISTLQKCKGCILHMEGINSIA
jgi:hypothetical protein